MWDEYAKDQKLSYSIIADGAASAAYFRRADLVLSRAEVDEQPLGERWWLTHTSGQLYWYPNAGTSVSSLSEVWEQWWLRWLRIEWHICAARHFARTYLDGDIALQADVEAWLTTCGFNPLKRQQQRWPWTAAHADYLGGPIHLAGWPWHQPRPSSRNVPPMPEPASWKEKALLRTEISSLQPRAFVANLRMHIEQEAYSVNLAKAVAEAKTLRSKTQGGGDVIGIRRL